MTTHRFGHDVGQPAAQVRHCRGSGPFKGSRTRKNCEVAHCLAGEAGLGLKKVARAPLAGSCQWAVSWLTGLVRVVARWQQGQVSAAVLDPLKGLEQEENVILHVQSGTLCTTGNVRTYKYHQLARRVLNTGLVYNKPLT